MSGFAKWYLGRLKSHPMSTNMASAVVLMVTGDVLAQEMEMHFLSSGSFPSSSSSTSTPPSGGRCPGSSGTEGLEGGGGAVLLKNRLSFRRYGTLSPDVRAVKEELHRRTTEVLSQRQDMVLSPADRLGLHAKTAWLTVESEAESIDFFRCSTMALWSGLLSTPSFIVLYRFFDRVLPASSPATIAARVGITFLMSIPVNTVFFCYGTFVHHVTEWGGLIHEWRHEVPDASIRHVMRQVPFDWPMLQSSARLKVETELAPTVLASAAMWIPINAFNFTFVPPHLRPLTLTTFSAFWNCYLSLAQHREAKIYA